MSSERYDICIAIDTTGSMSPCIRKVQMNVKKMVGDLFNKIPGLRISIVAFQDYNDDYMWKAIDFTSENELLINFMENLRNIEGEVGPGSWYSNGETMQECYEYMLRKVQDLNWYSDSFRALVVVGDATPHSKEVALYHDDWLVELDKIKHKGINIYSVQAMNWGNIRAIKDFFRKMAIDTNGYHLYMDQMSMIIEMLTAVAFKQMGVERLQTYEDELRTRNNGMTVSMRQMFDVMLQRRTIDEIDEENRNTYDYSHISSNTTTTNNSSSSVPRISSRRKKDLTEGLQNLDESQFVLKPCAPGRFQVFDVNENVDIKQFADDNHLIFEKGKGFYEFKKPELIQKSKEIILQEKSTGFFFEGNKSRKMLNLIDYDEKKRIKPTDFDQYRIFVQSTSYNRKLDADSKFLYDSI